MFCNIAFGQNFHLLHRYDEALKQFEFSDQYGGCDEAIAGRWFLHFEQRGAIKIGLWSNDNSRKLKYHLDDESSPHVEVDDIFSNNPKWKRIGTHTLEIKNDKATHLFTIIPNYRTSNAKFSKEWIRFFEVGGKGRVFMIGFIPRYEDQFKSSKEFR